MGFTFIHTADWQVGKPFGNIPGDAGSLLRVERVAAVGRIAELARSREVEAVLVAGDAFDSNQVLDRTLIQTIDALKPFPGPWVFLPGNHDAALAHSVWTRLRRWGLPDNIVIADRAEPILLGDGRAVILPAPLRRRHEALDQTEWFDAAATPDGSVRIGLAHGSVAGRLPDRAESAHAISEDRARRAGLGYLALGDWHGALKIAPRTWYSGTPETDRHRANASGSAHVVSLDRMGAEEHVEAVATGRFRWIRRQVELVDGTADRAVEALLDSGGDAPSIVMELALRGVVGLAARRSLDEAIQRYGARFHHLEIDDTELVDEPSADDLDSIDTAGFVRLAVERLKQKAADPGEPQRDAARMALRMIYLDHASLT